METKCFFLVVLLCAQGRATDYSESDYIERYDEAIDEHNSNTSRVDIPEQINWITQKVVSRVVKQGKYPNSWAFAAIGLVESRLAIKTEFHKRKVIELSKQNLIDCMRAEKNRIKNSLAFIQKKQTIATEESYSYAGLRRSCRTKNLVTIPVKIKSISQIPLGDEALMAQEVARGPVVALINKEAINNYKGGVLSKVKCEDSLDYAVLVVGYGRSNAQDYWLLKASRGKDWGENGYMKLARNENNLCGIATKALFVTL